jgi:hypothetical protein
MKNIKSNNNNINNNNDDDKNKMQSTDANGSDPWMMDRGESNFAPEEIDELNDYEEVLPVKEDKILSEAEAELWNIPKEERLKSFHEAIEKNVDSNLPNNNVSIMVSLQYYCCV